MANRGRGGEPTQSKGDLLSESRVSNALGTARRSSQGGSVADTILQQLGGNQFLVMTGAKNLAADSKSLRFDIGKNGSKANRVKVTLRGDDTYDMEFWKKGSTVNPYTILMRYANKGLSPAEFNAKVKAATEKASRNAEPKLLKKYSGIYFDQLQSLFTEYTKLYTKLF